MADRLVTVATFHDPVAAALARNFLEGEGIAACLIDEATIATDWMIAGAIGGIKLQVEPLQFERAEMLMTRVRAEKDEAAANDEPTPATAIASQEIAEELQAEREDRAPINQLTDKLFRSAVFGLIFWPLQFYTLYLLVCIGSEEGKVSPSRRWKIWTSMLLNMPLMGVIVIPVLWLISSYSWQAGSPANPVWRRQLFNDHGFSVKLPHEAQYREGMAMGRFGEVHTQTWTAWSHHRAYRVVIDRYANLPRMLSTEELLRAVTRDRLVEGRGKMRQEAPIDFKGIPGREYWLEFASYQERGRCYLRGQDLVLVYVQGSQADVESAEAEEFLQSFRIR